MIASPQSWDAEGERIEALPSVRLDPRHALDLLPDSSGKTHVSVFMDDLPNASLEGGYKDRKFAPGTISLVHPVLMTAEDVAVAYTATMMVAALHEGMEWTHVGQAHPPSNEEDVMWDWCVEQTQKIVREYIARWPGGVLLVDPPG